MPYMLNDKDVTTAGFKHNGISYPVGFASLAPQSERDALGIVWVDLPVFEPDYRLLRAMAYPPMADYLDGIVKGDIAQVQKYIDDCNAVKLQYPKPGGTAS